MDRPVRIYCRNKVRLLGFLWRVRCDRRLPDKADVCPECGAPVHDLPTRPASSVDWANWYLMAKSKRGREIAREQMIRRKTE